MSKVNRSVKQSDNFCKYYRGLQGITGGITGSLAWKELEFHFSSKKTEDGFFKFLEPCGHRLYKEGDSWTEKLEFSKDEWRHATKSILEQYGSLTSFKKSQDVFKGKLYASYYDRPNHLTYYFRNHELANKMVDEYFSTGHVTVTESNYPSMSGIPISGDLIACRESRLPEVDNPDFVIEKQNITSKDKIHSSQKDLDSRENEERNLKKNLKKGSSYSDDVITSKVSDERSKTVMSENNVGKFKTLESVPYPFLEEAVKKFNVRSDRIKAVEASFLEFYIRNNTPKTLEKWSVLFFEYVGKRRFKVPTDFEAPKIVKACDIVKYKKRYGIDKIICDILKKKIGLPYFYSWIETQGAKFLETDTSGIVKLLISSGFAQERFDQEYASILKPYGYEIKEFEISA